MPDEEKKEYEKIKYNNEHLYCDKKDVDYLLNLIEKQYKEIEEKDGTYDAKIVLQSLLEKE